MHFCKMQFLLGEDNSEFLVAVYTEGKTTHMFMLDVSLFHLGVAPSYTL